MRRGSDILDRQELFAGIHALHRDAGGTIITDIYLGEELILSFQPATRHIETARTQTDELAQSILKTLFASAADKLGLVASTDHRILDYDDDEGDIAFNGVEYDGHLYAQSAPINLVAHTEYGPAD